MQQVDAAQVERKSIEATEEYEGKLSRNQTTWCLALGTRKHLLFIEKVVLDR